MMDGIVSVIKPPAMSSSDVVVDIRRLFEQKKVGHSGTLDPGAAGVLPICLGRGTKLFDYLVDKKKQYLAELYLGESTDTQDSYGRVLSRSDRVIGMDELKAVLPQFVGKQQQIAPIYSALKLDGRKLYDYALSGQSVPDKIRSITIDALELVEQIDINRYLLRVDCSRGTYIRTLCQDIGARLNVPARLSFLIRTRAGEFTLENSYTLAQLGQMKEQGILEQAVIDCNSALAFLPRVDIPFDRAIATKNGLPTHLRGAESGVVRCFANGEFLGIARILNETLKLEVHLY